MSKKNSSMKNSSGVSAGIIASAIALVPIDERGKLVSVPELYSNQFPLTVEQAVERLKNCGLSATLIKASVHDARPRYRNCFNSQVISSRPKAKQKVVPGSSVSVKYITQEIIEESQRIFEENERAKSKQKFKKAAKQKARKEKVKHVTSEVLEAAKKTIKTSSNKKEDLGE